MNEIINAHSVTALEKAITPILGWYALYLQDKGVDPASRKGLDALAGFRHILMTRTIKDGENAFVGLNIKHQDLFTIYDAGYDVWQQEMAEAATEKALKADQPSTPLDQILTRIGGK